MQNYFLLRGMGRGVGELIIPPADKTYLLPNEQELFVSLPVLLQLTQRCAIAQRKGKGYTSIESVNPK